MSDWKDDLNAALEKEEGRKDIIEEKAKKEKEATIQKQREKIYREFFMKAVHTAFMEMKSVIEKKKDVEIGLPDGQRMWGLAHFIVYAKDTMAYGNTDKEFHYIISADTSETESIVKSDYYISPKNHYNHYEGQIKSVRDYTTISVNDICEDITNGYKRMVEKALES